MEHFSLQNMEAGWIWKWIKTTYTTYMASQKAHLNSWRIKHKAHICNGQKVHHFSLNYLLFIDHFLLRGVLITHNFTYVHIHAQKTTIIMNWFSIVFCMYVCTYCETVWATSFNLSLKPNIYVYRIEAPQV